MAGPRVEFPTAPTSRLTSGWRPLLVLGGLTVAAYANALQIPFQLDEPFQIEQNPLVHDLSYFADPGRARLEPEYGVFVRRYLSFLTYAVSYRIHGLEPLGYHLVSLLLHLANVGLLFALLGRLLRTPALAGVDAAGPRLRGLRLLCAGAFAVHPLQTEAVNYVLGRSVLLVAFFYLLSIHLFVGARLRQLGGQPGARTRFGLALASAVAAVLCKEHAVTLPFAALLVELVFFPGTSLRRLLWPASFLVQHLVFIFLAAEAGTPLQQVLLGVESPAQSATRSVFDTSFVVHPHDRLAYLLTEAGVVLDYLRLLLLPVGQSFLHEVPLARSLWEPTVLLAVAASAAAVSGAAVLSLGPGAAGRPLGRLFGFGVLWFFLTLSVESSVVPMLLPEVEYRAYLPAAGGTLAVGAALSWAVARLRAAGLPAAGPLLGAALLGALATATHVRNRTWQTRLSLWEDVVEKAPGSARGRSNLGYLYEELGLTEKAIAQYAALAELGGERRAQALGRLVALHERAGRLPAALEHQRRLVELSPQDARAWSNLASFERDLGRFAEAARFATRALELDPSLGEARLVLGIARFSLGDLAGAEAAFEEQVRRGALSADAHNGLAIVRVERGQLEQALTHFEAALALAPARADVRFNLARLLQSAGRLEEAARELLVVLRQAPQDQDARSLLEEVERQRAERPAASGPARGPDRTER